MYIFSKRHRYEILLGLLIVLYVGFFSYLSILRHTSLHSEYYDLGIMDQTVYNTSRGRILQLTNPTSVDTVYRMAIHNDILLALFAPFYWIHAGPETLLIIQTVILALGAIFIFKLGHLILHSDPLALTFATIYLLYPPLQWSNLYDFHAVTIATTLILAAFYFEMIESYIISFVFVLLALLSKEQVGATMAVWGLYLLFKKKHRRFGLAVFLISTFWTIVSFFVIIPYFRKGSHFALERYVYIKDLASIVRHLWQYSTLRYIVILLLPLAFLSLLSVVSVVALPEFAANLLSASGNQRDILHHYTAIITPFLFLGAIYGLYTVLKKRHIATNLVAIFLITVILIGSFLWSPLPYSRSADMSLFDEHFSEEKSVNNWQKKLADENISIAASGTLAPHFSDRRVIIRFSEQYKVADYVLIWKPQVVNDWYDYVGTPKNYQQLVNDVRFKKIFEQGKLEVYKKQLTPKN